MLALLAIGGLVPELLIAVPAPAPELSELPVLPTVLPLVVPGEIEPPSVVPPTIVEPELGLEMVDLATVELSALDPMAEVPALPAVLPPPMLVLGATVDELMVLPASEALVEGRTHGVVVIEPEMPEPTEVCAMATPAPPSAAAAASRVHVLFNAFTISLLVRWGYRLS